MSDPAIRVHARTTDPRPASQPRVVVVGLPAPKDALAERIARLGARLEVSSDPEATLATLDDSGPVVIVLGPSVMATSVVSFASRIRRSPRSSQIALLAIAAREDPRLELVAYREGVDAVLPPKVGVAQIAARIQGQLRRLRAQPIATAAATGSPAPESAALQVPDVIVVEDDPGMAEMLRYTLEGRGYRVASYRDGPSALAALRRLDAGSRRPVVLLDVDLPGLDGFRLLQELSEARPGDYQIVLCTVHRSEAAQVLGIQSGAVDYLVKPLQMPVVLAKVDRLVGLLGSR